MDTETSSARTPPILISIGGLPATGKTTIARLVAVLRGAAYVRVDTIEAAIAAAEGSRGSSNDWELAPGYVVARAVTADQLRAGLDVVAESVNPLDVTRDAWRDVAATHGAQLLEVEVICSDPVEHRRRAEARVIDIPGLVGPTWQEIVDRDYRPWDRSPLVVDTALLDADAGAAAVQSAALRLG